MIIAPSNFRDEELFEPKAILEKSGLEVKVASTSLSVAVGSRGGSAKPDILVSDIRTGDFAGIIFVGGAGSSQYWDDALAHKLAQEAVKQNKVIAAICGASVTLANAGILNGKRATVWPSEGDRLKAKGADYTAQPVEKDGNIITAAGPSAATAFAEEIVKALK